ncbi:hypothetical protein ElyMa_001269700 [Elysia marginata]|uniref:Reverse transcriptase zinc-binding domain-containing protein n=1 Tax=Elysia marginata TaxID=1093978 RepID=A0AAV4IDR3_9GAST|nr:hypothetical protein ElyMa_001269700 [Elysia marginata]
MVKRVVFNGKGSTFTSWFSASRVILSSWADLTIRSHNYFSLFGADHITHFRRFFMNLDYRSSCTGYRGWFKATETQAGCPKEVKTLAIPRFAYAPGDTFAVWESNAALADAFGVFLSSISSWQPPSIKGTSHQIEDGPNCPCGANRQDAQHVLQDCPLLDDTRLKYWPEPREMNQKLYGSALQLGITAEFIYASDLTI